MSYTLTIADAGDGASAVPRLRRLLKCLLRAYGFRCTSISAAEPPGAPAEAMGPSSDSVCRPARRTPHPLTVRTHEKS